MRRLNAILFVLGVSVISCKKMPEHRSVAFQIDERDLFPEGIGYSESTGNFYLSSIHKSKIIEVDESGNHSDFISSGEYGFLPGMGILVDDKNANLWAIGSDVEANKKSSRLFLFDLSSGTLKKSLAPQDSKKHFLNDLTLTETGDLFTTDSDNQSIYSLGKNGEELELFLESEEIQYPNGMTYSAKNQTLYVASFTKGIRAIELSTKDFLNTADSTSLTRGIDGLKYFKGTLFGVQNGFQTREKHKVVQFTLDDAESKIIDSKIIDENNPHFEVPTTLVIKEASIFLIANSQLPKLDQSNNAILKMGKLSPIFILHYRIDTNSS